CYFLIPAAVGRDGKDGRDHMVQSFRTLFNKRFSGLLNLCYFRTSAVVGRDGKDGRDHMVQSFLILFIK
ncbi:MAG: hypothetical protein WBF33_24775, partial [Candidatus Nitrosopolaris sp.]